MSHKTAKTLLFSVLPLFLLPLGAQAQIAADGTTSTTVTSTAEGVQIDNGDRSGGNLFHSFQDFSIPTGTEAHFNNASDVANIFSRVTGGNVSDIDGLIRANGTASLFLINPNGIIFGENASLQLGGSFFATTADGILFDDGVAFSASDPTVPLLTSSIPVGANFRDNLGDITNKSVALDVFDNSVGLQVDAGKTLALVGGEINFSGGRLNAPEGHIELGGLAEAGLIELVFDGDTISLNFSEDSQLANLNLAEDARVGVEGFGGGTISVNANIFTATNGGRLVAGTRGIEPGGDISVTANQINFSGDSTTSAGSGLYNQASPESAGNTGNIIVNTQSFTATSGSGLTILVTGTGNGGNIILNANEIDISGVGTNSGFGSGINNQAIPESLGNAGNISINTDSLIVNADGIIQSITGGAGNSGDVEIISTNLVELTDAKIETKAIEPATGDAGNVSVITDTIRLLDDSSINSSNFSGSGNAGTVNIKALNKIDLLGDSFIDSLSVGQGNGGDITLQTEGSVFLAEGSISSNVLLGSDGRGGDINIFARSLSLTNSSIGSFGTEEGAAGNVAIQTTDFVTLDNDSSISAFASGRRSGGNVTIDSSKLSILNSSVINVSILGGRKSGNIAINTTDSVKISNSSRLFLNTNGTGDAGTLVINTGKLMINNGSQLSTATFASGKGGAIDINATESVEITGISADGLTISSIGAETSGFGAGGNIQVTTNNLLVRDGSAISAFSVGSGKGGTITLNVSDSINIEGFRPLGFFPSSIDTESGDTGNAGNIDIYTRNLLVSNGAKITTATTGDGNGGIIDISATELIEVSGFIPHTTISSQISSQSLLGEGAAGKIEITTPSLLVRDAGQINVSSFTNAIAGNIEINADVIEIDNFGILNAQTFGGEGNINLSSKDIFLRGQSNITTNAFGSSTGGNVNIDTENLVAFPNENSDISANAEDSFGGRVNITADGIFGTEFREEPTSKSDITATSELGPNFSGEVAINTPEVDPASGLVELPQTVGDPSDQIALNPCEQGVGSEFTITGKGGFPANPQNNFSSNEVRVGLVQPVTPENQTATAEENKTFPTEEPAIVPAQGWVFNDEGKVVLTAYDPTNQGVQRTQKSFAGCSIPQNQAQQHN